MITPYYDKIAYDITSVKWILSLNAISGEVSFFCEVAYTCFQLSSFFPVKWLNTRNVLQNSQKINSTEEKNSH